MKKIVILLAAVVMSGLAAADADACTGISLTALDGSQVVARTVEWAATPMQCGYVVAPRGHKFRNRKESTLRGAFYRSIPAGIVFVYD